MPALKTWSLVTAIVLAATMAEAQRSASPRGQASTQVGGTWTAEEDPRGVAGGRSYDDGKWIDVELLIQVSRRYEEMSIVIIGLNEKNPNIDKLHSLNNIYFLGMKSREEVPEYISNFDVCLMPFNRTKIGEGLLPLKMFEYLALGKPVVATSSKVLKQFSDVLYLANDTDMFLEHIKNAITNHSREYSDFRRDYALKYSWGNRVNDYLSKIQEFINRR